MLCARDAHVFKPIGRQYCTVHPSYCNTERTLPTSDCGTLSIAPPSVRTLKEDTGGDHPKSEFWLLCQSSSTSEACDEELYVSGHVVVWSRGSSEAAGAVQVLRCFTTDSPVLEALWCNFLLPVDQDVCKQNVTPANPNTVGMAAVLQSSVCVIEAGCFHVFTSDGRDYAAALPFPVKRTWVIQNGLLFERQVLSTKGDLAKTPKKEESQPKMPVLFSLSHALDEIAPVICRTGGGGTVSKISFVTEMTQEVVYTSEEPSLVMTYDRQLSVHSVWKLRQTKPKELEVACGGHFGMSEALTVSRDMGGATPGLAAASQSASSLFRFTLSTHSPSTESPFHSHASKLSSPSAMGVSGLSRIHSPAHSRSMSPSLGVSSLYRLHTTPSPQVKSSPAGFNFQSPGGTTTSFTDHALCMELMEPLVPEICLDHIWTETGNIPRDGSSGIATKVFQTADFSGQQYFCYLIPFRHHLRCVKFEKSNDQTQLIFGSLSVIQARDAVSLTSRQMMVILDTSYTLALYSGLTKMNVLHIPGLQSLISFNAVGRSSPKYESSHVLDAADGPTTSSRPASAMDVRLDEQVQLMSPVPTELNESSQLIEQSMMDEPSIQTSGYLPGSHCGVVAGLRDNVHSRFTIELSDGSLYRTSIAEMTTSPIISKCLEALCETLPRDAAMLVHCRWYCHRNQPGGTTGHIEWHQFVMCLLGIMGYSASAATRTLLTASVDSVVDSTSPKKPRLSDAGSNSDWEYLLSSDHHRHFSASHDCYLGFDSSAEVQARLATRNLPPSLDVDTTAPLFPHISTILFALHLVYEDMRLDAVLQSLLPELGTLLCFIARDIGCELYVDHYSRDLPELHCIRSAAAPAIAKEDLLKVHYPHFFTEAPPDIYRWLYNYLHKQDCAAFPCIPSVTLRLEHVVMMYVSTFDKDLLATDVSVANVLKRISAVGRRTSDAFLVPPKSLTQSADGSQMKQLLQYLAEIDPKMTKNLALGVSIPMQEAIFASRRNPSPGWPESLYQLIGREDLMKQCRLDCEGSSISVHRPIVITADKSAGDMKTTQKDDSDGMSYLDDELLALRFSNDQRLNEVRRLLVSSQPVRIAIPQRPEVSDHEFIEEQERHLYAKCIRTMALPVGRGMFTLCTYHPVSTETLQIPKLCLTGKVPSRNTAVDLTHIDTPANMNYWPLFHNGVAAGLKISNTSQLESSWILFNKAKSETLTNEHAGFLMGQGLNGHLAKLATLNVHDYLIKTHDMTSMGLLLGIAANKRGTMDMASTKLLSIHIPALLPPTSTELDVPHIVKVAAVLGIGLVYQGTAHRHIAEVLLSEIGRPPGPETENSIDRESYSLAAGLGLGLVMLGKGCEVLGLSDMVMPDQLYLYMVGGQKRPVTGSCRELYKSPSYQIKEGECVNVDVTGPGATMALGLMFFNTNNSSVADWFVIPDTQSLLDFVRPDFLLLRVLSRSLIMWNSICPSEAWINSNLPHIVAMYAFNKSKYADDPDCDIDFETMSQAYCNIVAGACLAVGLKYAGSASAEAFTCLFETVKRVLRLMSKPAVAEQAGKMAVENCIIVVVLSLAAVMAGTGDLNVLRLCRYLRTRIGSPFGFVSYGSHMAIAMAIGLLFLGGGKYTLSTRPESIAAMLCAFFPKFPTHSNDNRYHLQALRHLYVLAAEKRIVIPRDIDSHQACYVELELVFKNQEVSVVMAPCILPELHLLTAVRVKGPRYWPVEFQVDTNWQTLRRLLESTGCLFVKQRAGYLSYAVDPKGYHGLLSQSMTTERMYGKVLTAKDIESYSSDPAILALAEQFCTSCSVSESETSQLLSQLLYDAVAQEKLQILALQIALNQCVAGLEKSCRPLILWQLKLLAAFYDRVASSSLSSDSRLLSQEFLVSLQSRIETVLNQWVQKSGKTLVQYFSGSVDLSADTSSWCLLSAFLTWYNVPHPKPLAQMGLTGIPSFPQLYIVLRPSGLRVSDIQALCNAMTVALNETQ